jgi:hypothetical protein
MNQSHIDPNFELTRPESSFLVHTSLTLSNYIIGPHTDPTLDTLTRPEYTHVWLQMG